GVEVVDALVEDGLEDRRVLGQGAVQRRGAAALPAAQQQSRQDPGGGGQASEGPSGVADEGLDGSRDALPQCALAQTLLLWSTVVIFRVGAACAVPRIAPRLTHRAAARCASAVSAAASGPAPPAPHPPARPGRSCSASPGPPGTAVSSARPLRAGSPWGSAPSRSWPPAAAPPWSGPPGASRCRPGAGSGPCRTRTARRSRTAPDPT